jgi:hypothetical protein
MLAGRPHEAAGNGSPRWMAVGPRERVHRTRPTGPLARRPLPTALPQAGPGLALRRQPGRCDDAHAVAVTVQRPGGLQQGQCWIGCVVQFAEFVPSSRRW